MLSWEEVRTASQPHAFTLMDFEGVKPILAPGVGDNIPPLVTVDLVDSQTQFSVALTFKRLIILKWPSTCSFVISHKLFLFDALYKAIMSRRCYQSA